MAIIASAKVSPVSACGSHPPHPWYRDSNSYHPTLLFGVSRDPYEPVRVPVQIFVSLQHAITSQNVFPFTDAVWGFNLVPQLFRLDFERDLYFLKKL